MKPQRLLVFLLIGVSVALTIIPSFQYSQALTPSVVQSASCHVTNQTVPCSFPSTPTVGDEVIVLYGFYCESGSGNHPTTFSDNQSPANTYTVGVVSGGDNFLVRATIAYAPIVTSSGTFTVQATFNQATCVAVFSTMSIYEVSNFGGIGNTALDTCGGSCTGTALSTSSMSFGSTSLTFSIADNIYGGSGTAISKNGGTGWITYGCGQLNLNCGAGYSTTEPSPSIFAWTSTNSAIWQEVALEVIPAAVAQVTVTVTRSVACNFYQQQCWWEPMIFYGMYVGLWLGIATSINVRAKSLTFILGAATSYASLYLILLGELPYPFAFIAFGAAFVYALRLDGVF